MPGLERGLLEKIKKLVGEDRYRIRLHAVRHMIEEGFDEHDIVEAIAGAGRILENYPDDSRCLILGYFVVGTSALRPVHVVCDYGNERVVDIVTAYVPEKPWWVTPTKRGRTV